MLKSLLVSDQLDRHILLSFVVETFNGLAKATLAKEFNNFEPVCYVVFKHNFVVASLIVITKVIGMKRGTLDLLGFNAKIVDLLMVKNLSFLMVSQVTHEQFKSFGWSDGIFQVLYLLLQIFNRHSSQ